jgi:hypothetical protein
MKKLVIFLLCTTLVYAQNLAEYPGMFFDVRDFNALIIKGDVREAGEINAANYLLTRIPKKYLVLVPIEYGGGYYSIRAREQVLGGKVRLASQVSELTTNAIIIGTPCHNVWIQKLLNIVDCENYLKPNEALVKLMTANGHDVLILTGYDGVMVYEATKYLHERPPFLLQARELKLKRDKYTYSYPIGGGREILPIGVLIGEKTPVYFYERARVQGDKLTRYRTYLRFTKGGKVVLGKG